MGNGNEVVSVLGREMIKPILFNTEMVKAIIDDRKTVTRRIIKPQPDMKHQYPLGFATDSTEKKDIGCFGFGIDEYGGSIQYAKPPYNKGDILYVRETWKYAPNGYYYYEDWLRDDIADVTKWKPSIHMPKDAARIFLKVMDVRVERLQDITVEQIYREGVETEYPFVLNGEEKIYAFSQLWDSTIKKNDIEKCGWKANHWVWVIEFEKCEKPKDF